MKCGECPHQDFVAVSDDTVRSHLQGRDLGAPDKQADYVAGVYPLLPDETCRFLAVDFDKASWQSDASAFVATCHGHGVGVAVERSRSGNGAHVWIFFAQPVLASDARKLGSLLLTATMERRPDIGFESYDRFFPSQDTMPTSWRGLLSQYAGRLHRAHSDKRDVVIYDYVDAHEPMLAKMATKRRAGYHNLGYTEVSAEDIRLRK